MKQVVWLCAFTLSLFASLNAQAQWQWLDQSGRKMYSDQPPPASVPEGKILKGADGRPYLPAPKAAAQVKAPSYKFAGPEATPVAGKAKAAAPLAAASGAKAAAKPLTADAKRAAEKKLAEEKKAEQARLAAENERKAADAKECARMANSLAGLNSGVRIATVDAKGERSFMDDASLAAERKRITDMMAERCR